MAGGPSGAEEIFTTWPASGTVTREGECLDIVKAEREERKARGYFLKKTIILPLA